MSSKFTTPLILSSALALSAFSFIACSEDSNPGIPSQVGNSSSSYVPPDIPQQTATTAIVFSGLGADQTMATQVFFTGSIKLDFSDTNITPENSTIRFTDLKLFVESASKTSSGSIKTNLSADGSIPADYFATQQPTTISFDKIGLYADLADGYTECGNFNLIIAATAMDPANEATKSVSIDTIPFIRGEQNCKIPESSSSSIAVPGAPLVAGTTTISTKDNKCFTFATGTATADATVGDICITRYTKDSFTLSSGTGLKFAFYDNPKDADRKNDWTSERLPEAPTTDNFTYKEANLKETISNIQNEIENFVVCIAPTYVPNSGSATGFYTFTISDVSVPDGNGDVVFSITYLKAAQ